MYRGGCRRHRGLFILPVVLLMTGLLMVIAGGCGNNDDSATASSTDTTSTTISPTTSETSDPTTPETSGTTTSTASESESTGHLGTTVSVSSTNGAYPKENAPDWSQIKSAEAYRNASYGVASLFVSLATYDVTAGSISEYWDLPYPPAGQGRIELVLTRTVADINEPPLVTGKYDFNIAQGQAELTGAAGIVLPDGSTVTFSVGALESDVQVTAVSDTEVSGTFSVKDKWSEISGTFTAPVK